MSAGTTGWATLLFVPYILISRGRRVRLDAGDLAYAQQYHWTYLPRKGRNEGYALRWERGSDGKRKTIYMHRELLDAPVGVEVDHRNGNGLDNRRSNLRLASSSLNKVNRGHSNVYRGVYAEKRPGRRPWKVQAKHRGRVIHLGTYDDVLVAARAYDAFALETWGDFAQLNFPQ